MEVEETTPGAVAGRFFVKQDHQGAEPGFAHEGILATALSEAMAFACGLEVHATRLEVQLVGRAPVAAFVEVEAQARPDGDGGFETSASATAEEQPVATASGRYKPR